MKVLITDSGIRNPYVHSLINAYQRTGCEVVAGVADFYLSNFRADLLHVQWPESLCHQDWSVLGRPEEVIPERIRGFIGSGAKIAFTVHNLHPHQPRNDVPYRDIYNSIIELSDVIVHHGRASIGLMAAEYPVLSRRKGTNNLSMSRFRMQSSGNSPETG